MYFGYKGRQNISNMYINDNKNDKGIIELWNDWFEFERRRK